MKKLAILSVMGLALMMGVGCTDADGARKALKQRGFTNIETTGYRFTGCSKGDVYQTGFQAKGPSGEYVTGVVCSGWFKGNTVRTD